MTTYLLQPPDITSQLVDTEQGSKIDIMLGGGRASWLPRNDTNLRWDYDTYNWDCLRWDQRNLIDEWKAKTNGKYVANRDELMAISMQEEKVLGIFHFPMFVVLKIIF